MILESIFKQVVEQQKSRLQILDGGMKRELIPNLQSLSSHALIISGIRRGGKSTLMLQIIKQINEDNFLYLNFESPLLYNFSITDFSRLDNILKEKQIAILFLDEIQLVEKWEIYVRQKLDEGLKVIVTGSNASLLSKELGTKLTGRHITRELFPFSFKEFLRFKNLAPSSQSLSVYMKSGGFPEYLKSNDAQQLATLFDDIILRDIVARYGIKDIKSLQRLASFLISNIGNRITANKLKQPLSVGATSTILTWLSHLELAYLFSFVPMYSHSTKAQLVNPRKVYSIDLGMIECVSTKLAKDSGKKLENLIFLHLRQKYKYLFYLDLKKNGECDFIAMNHGQVDLIIQVCYQLTPDNMNREIKGLIEAMRFFNHPEGTIVTFSDKDEIQKEGFNIKVVPAHEFLLR